MLTIIMPAYNEEKRIGKTLQEYASYFDKDTEILVVINNTRDRTEEIVKYYQVKYQHIKYLNFKKGGKGFAIMEGFKEALKNKDNTLIGFVDADLSTSAEAFHDLIKNIENSDGVIASRYLTGSIVTPAQPFKRILASRVFNIIVRTMFFFSYSDTQCGAKIFKRYTLERIINNIGVTNWAFDIDLLYHLHKEGFNIKEHPTVWANDEDSKINLGRSSLQMLLACCRLRLCNSPFAFMAPAFRFLIKPIWNLVK